MIFIGQQSVLSSLTACWGSLIPFYVCVPPLCHVFFLSAILVTYFGTLITPPLKIHRKCCRCGTACWGSLIYFAGTEISGLTVVYLNRHVFHRLTERCQLSGRLLTTFYPRSCLCATEKRVVLGLKVLIVCQCYICAVAAELCGCSCRMLLQSCAVYCAFLLGQDVQQQA